MPTLAERRAELLRARALDLRDKEADEAYEACPRIGCPLSFRNLVGLRNHGRIHERDDAAAAAEVLRLKLLARELEAVEEDRDYAMREGSVGAEGPVEMDIEGDYGGGEEEFESDIPSPAATRLEHPVMGNLRFERHPLALDNAIPAAALPPPKRPRAGASKSYAPYATRSDFMVADYAISTGQSFASTNALYKVLHHEEFRLEDLQYKNSDHLRAALGTVEPLGGKMIKSKIKIAYDGEDRIIDVPHVDIMSILRGVVADPAMAPHFKLFPERWFREGEDGSPERMIDEYMSADDAWDYHDEISADGLGGKPYHLRFYSDESKLSTFGEIKCWPVYMWILNLPRHLQEPYLVGYQPVIDYDYTADQRKTPAFTAFRREVYQAAWGVFLDPCAGASQFGEEMVFGDEGRVETLHPLGVVISGDYQEFVKLIIGRGYTGAQPCPKCHCPRHESENLCSQFDPKTAEEHRKLYEEVSRDLAEGRKAEGEKKLQEAGTHHVFNAFWRWHKSCSVHRAIANDPLHRNELGVWGKHILPLLTLIAGDAGNKLLDARAQDMARWSGLHSFNGGFTSLPFVEGNFYLALLKFFPGIIRDVFPDDQEVVGRLIREVCVGRIYEGLDVHTPTTLLAGKASIKRLELIMKSLCRKYEKDLNFPKWHAGQHIFDGIRAKGSVLGTSSKEGEALHPAHHRAFKNTNGKDYMTQMNDKLSITSKHAAIIRRIRRDPIESRILLDLPTPDTFDSGSSDLVRYLSQPPSEPPGIELKSMRAPVRLDIWLHDLERRQNPAFKDFETGLRFFLHEEYYDQERTRELLQTRRLQSNLIIPFGVLKAWYTSLEDFRIDSDRLVVNPSFHGRRREDSVIVRGNNDEDLWFYRLLAIFTIIVDQTPLEIAYGRPYKVTKREPFTQCILATLVGPADTDFFWVRSIVRGVHAYSASDKKKNLFVINDLIDPDAFFRLRHIKPADDDDYWVALELSTRAEDARLAEERVKILAQEAADRALTLERRKAHAARKREKKARKRARRKAGLSSSEEEDTSSEEEETAQKLDAKEKGKGKDKGKEKGKEKAKEKVKGKGKAKVVAKPREKVPPRAKEKEVGNFSADEGDSSDQADFEAAEAREEYENQERHLAEQLAEAFERANIDVEPEEDPL
ncbi:hypothetical protein P7C70_g6968, partial [Phenoliferia sp. Uapishka_3]